MTEQFTVELSDNQATKVKRAADLFDQSPEQFLRQAANNRLEAVDNILRQQAARQRTEQ